MKVQSVAIAKEVLNGSILNRNSQTISHHLKILGFTIDRHLVIDDVKDAIEKTVADALLNYPLSIFTGGLGPTCDDITKLAVAHAIKTNLYHDEHVYQDLKARFGNYPSLQNQSNQVFQAILFKNSVGTAYGFAVEKNGHYAIFLPGVPIEMETMLHEEILPWLEKIFKTKNNHEKQFLVLLKQEVEIDPTLKKLEKEGIEIGIYPNYGFLHVLLKAKTSEKLDYAVQIFKQEFETFIVEESLSLSRGLIDYLINHRQTISFAESCTGGKVSSLLVENEGVSETFLGSIVCYSNSSKVNILDIDSLMIEKEGAVSEAVALQMARNVKEKFQSKVSGAITGIAGPTGGSLDKPIGTVIMAICFDNQQYVGRLPAHPFTKREIIVSYSANYLLASIYRFLKFKKIPFHE